MQLGTASVIFSSIVAIEHIYIFILETFLWRGRARKVFKTTVELAESTAGLAANQGIYNSFLAFGIIYGLVEQKEDIVGLFLLFVIGAALFGAVTVSPRILLMQGLPAVIAELLVLFEQKQTKEQSLRGLWVLLASLGFLAVGLVWRALEDKHKHRLLAPENTNQKE
eukprot:c20557_g1_i1.p1 GENE.c20557_g1_i1~~c20557_g1_i1.p1  ORF type:complete len:180 (+),score=50.77 c20557_g1_i1:42-542(+)